jgi:hypothetical protein
MNPIIGIDFGGTILTRKGKGRGSSLVDYPDAFRVIRRLTSEIAQPEKVYIVSRVNEVQEARARQWVLDSEFCSHTGIPDSNIHYCAERSEKAGICAKLGIDHFIDDQPEVLYHMHSIVPNRLLIKYSKDEVPCEFNLEERAPEFFDRLRDVVLVRNWKDVERFFFQK